MNANCPSSNSAPPHETFSTPSPKPCAPKLPNWHSAFVYNDVWLGKSYTTKQVEVVAAHEGADWIVITAIARYF
jgi:hypothetical protein